MVQPVFAGDRPMRELLDELGLQDYESVESTTSMIQDCGQEVFAVLKPVSNKNSERLLLKERRSYLSDAEFRKHIELHRHIFRNCGPVVPLPASFVDRLPLSTPNKRLFEVLTWVEGSPVNPESASDLALLGNTLARFHIAAADFCWVASPDLHKEPRDRFAKAEFYRPLLRDGLGKSCHPLETRLYELLQHARTRLDSINCLIGPEALQAIHGDPDTVNALIVTDGCLLLDYDDAHLSTRAADLAWLATLTSGMERVVGSVQYSFRAEWSRPLLKAIIGGYQKRMALGTPGLEGLRWWMTASIVCAAVDCFFDDGCLVDRSRLNAECSRALELISELERMQLG